MPRDNLALASVARRLGVSAAIAEATHYMNQQQVSILTRLVKSKLPGNGRVGMLGLSYKANTDVVEESQGLLLAQSLVAEGIPVIAYDPAAARNAISALHNRVNLASSMHECVSASDVIVIATPWEEFKRIPIEMLARDGPSKVLVDCWRILDAGRYQGVVEYLPLGIGLQDNK